MALQKIFIKHPLYVRSWVRARVKPTSPACPAEFGIDLQEVRL